MIRQLSCAHHVVKWCGQPLYTQLVLPQVRGARNEALDSLGATTQLTCLRLSGTPEQPLQVTDPGISALAHYTQLRSLELRCMPDVTAAGWHALGGLTRLTRLRLDWRGAASVELLGRLRDLPLDQVCGQPVPPRCRA